jgi:peptide/nickel transport system permease protein
MAKGSFWKRHENLYFAVTNKKVLFGACLFTAILLLSIIGPYLTPYEHDEFAGPGYLPPSKEH